MVQKVQRAGHDEWVPSWGWDVQCDAMQLHADLEVDYWLVLTQHLTADRNLAGLLPHIAAGLAAWLPPRNCCPIKELHVPAGKSSRPGI